MAYNGRFSRSEMRPVQVFSRYTQRSRFACSIVLCVLCVVCLLLSACTPSAPATSSSSDQPVVQQTPKSRLTYVAIGASDTFGLGADDPQTENWAADLAGKLGDGIRFINLGIPGVHVHDALNAELPVALDAHPDLITIWLAVNDIADAVPLASYTHDLDLLLSKLRAAAPHARIAIANVPDITLLPHFQTYNLQALHTQIIAYNTVIATLATRYHLILVDLYVRWNDLAAHPEYISDDGFHPNAIGYTRLAEIFYAVLQANK